MMKWLRVLVIGLLFIFPGNLAHAVVNHYRAGTLAEDMTLVASAARTTSSNTADIIGFGAYNTGTIQLNVTAASGTAPTLDVYIDTSVDNGASYINVAHFTQVTAAAVRAFNITSNTPAGTTDYLISSDAAAGTVRQGLWGDIFRVRWVIAGTTPSFTFSVKAMFKN